MKLTEENLRILKMLGFELDIHGYYTRKEDGWGFRIESIRDFKTLINRIATSYYAEGADRAIAEVVDRCNKIKITKKNES